jgi:MOSC domain-containing protein YiiM
MPWLFQINTSDGGVPKLPVSRVEVGISGAAGDRQRNLKHHGGPDRALCLYSLERIMALQQEGHPIVPGATGENLTLAGLDWGSLALGMRLRVGARLEIETTSYTEPCRLIAGSFADGAIVRMLQDRNPGWSRLYAKVLIPGEIAVGDPVQEL